MGVSIDVSVGRLTKSNFSDTFGKARREALTETLQGIQEAAQAAIRFRSKTYRLSRSVRFSVHNDDDGEVFLDEDVAPYASYFHDGTGLYGDRHQEIILVPGHSKALHWTHGGQEHFASRVMSPGQTGEPFLYDAAVRYDHNIELAYDKAVDKALEEV